MPRARFADLLRLLAGADVEFVVVGMGAAVLQGAPLTTLDLDVVHRRTDANVARLLSVLGSLDAVYRHDPRGLRPQASHLSGPGHQLLRTSLGDLDCLGTIGEGQGYEELLGRTVQVALPDGFIVPHIGQRFPCGVDSAVPHWLQVRLASRLAVPHLGQVIISRSTGGRLQ